MVDKHDCYGEGPMKLSVSLETLLNCTLVVNAINISFGLSTDKRYIKYRGEATTVLWLRFHDKCVQNVINIPLVGEKTNLQLQCFH